MSSKCTCVAVFVTFFIFKVHPILIGQGGNPTLFNYLHETESPVSIIIDTDYKRLLRRSLREEYEPANFSVKIGDDYVLQNSSGKIRSRGNTRKEVCKVPPFKLDFSQNDLASIGLDTLDNLKLVLPCRNKSGPQQRLYKEKLAYDLFNTIDTNGMHTILVNIIFTADSKIMEEVVGFIVEDEDNYARRKNAKLVGPGKLIARNLNRQSFLKMTFFQYMISNTDWAVSERHNLEMVKLPNMSRVIAIPYDFDYSGFVNQPYAIPHSSLPIKSVKERYFHPYRIKSGEFKTMMKYFESKKEELFATCDRATFMSEKSRKESKKHISELFKLFNSERWLNRHLKD